MHLNQYLLGVVTLVEICTTVVAPVLEHSELDSFVCHYNNLDQFLKAWIISAWIVSAWFI